MLPWFFQRSRHANAHRLPHTAQHSPKQCASAEACAHVYEVGSSPGHKSCTNTRICTHSHPSTCTQTRLTRIDPVCLPSATACRSGIANGRCGLQCISCMDCQVFLVYLQVQEPESHHYEPPWTSYTSSRGQWPGNKQARSIVACTL